MPFLIASIAICLFIIGIIIFNEHSKNDRVSLIRHSSQSEDTGQDTLRFGGESDNWKVQYKAVTNGKNSETDFLKLRYIGDGQPPKESDYKIKGATGGYSGNQDLDNGVF